MWVIYRPVTREYPGLWAARMHVCLPAPKPTRFVITHPRLDGLRELLPAGLAYKNRHPRDLPEIHETWV